MNNQDKLTKKTADLRKEVDAEKDAKSEAKELALKDLKSLSRVGMSHVDPADIQPPHVLLVQALTDKDELIDIAGGKPEDGQFFDTGNREILAQFDCYFVFAKKGTYIDKRKPEDGPKPMYQVVGVMKNDMKMFGMMLRSSASYSLNKLFSTAVSQELPMFAFNCRVESKELSNDHGKWYIPAVRIGEVEKDLKIINTLLEFAKRFDEQADNVDLGDNVKSELEGEETIQ